MCHDKKQSKHARNRDIGDNISKNNYILYINILITLIIIHYIRTDINLKLSVFDIFSRMSVKRGEVNVVVFNKNEKHE